MFICNDCGNVFEEPEYFTWTETLCVLDGRPYREDCAEPICPDCGTTNFEEAYACENCGEWGWDFELTDGLCDKCRKDLENDYSNLENDRNIQCRCTACS